jgi:hypothetical protein
MPSFATQTVSDQSQIASESQHDIRFRPRSPGQITVLSTPSPVPMKSQTETGLLGKVELRRPGSGVPVASLASKIGENHLVLSYTATSADLATAGDWTCRILNSSLIKSVFATQITSVSDFPLKTASFDLGLLGNMLSAAARTAALRVHLESSSDGSPQSVASWSVPVASSFGGSVESRFKIDDPSKTLVDIRNHTIDTTFRLLGLNSDPAYPIISVLTNPMRFFVALRFNTQGALLKAKDAGVPDINIDSFAISATVGFDGTIVPQCDVTAILRFNNTDVSGDVKSSVEAAILGQLAQQKITPALVRQKIESFFVLLMRLSDSTIVHGYRQVVQGHVQSYSVQGNSLVVSYYQVPVATQQLPLQAVATARVTQIAAR